MRFCVFAILFYIGCSECYKATFITSFYYLFLLYISFFFFDMDRWSDTND